MVLCPCIEMASKCVQGSLSDTSARLHPIRATTHLGNACGPLFVQSTGVCWLRQTPIGLPGLVGQQPPELLPRSLRGHRRSPWPHADPGMPKSVALWRVFSRALKGRPAAPEIWPSMNAPNTTSDGMGLSARHASHQDKGRAKQLGCAGGEGGRMVAVGLQHQGPVRHGWGRVSRCRTSLCPPPASPPPPARSKIPPTPVRKKVSLDQH